MIGLKMIFVMLAVFYELHFTSLFARLILKNVRFRTERKDIERMARSTLWRF
jgi:hypothetical protein